MPNIDAPRGAEPIKRIGGGDPALNYWEVDLTSGRPDIGLYDFVERGSNGLIRQAQASSTTIVGIAMQPYTISTGVAGDTIAVADAKDTVFLIQSDGDFANAAALDLNYNIAVAARNAVTLRSTMELDVSTGAASVDLPLKVLRLADVISYAGNEYGDFALLECVINRGIFEAGALG